MPRILVNSNSGEWVASKDSISDLIENFDEDDKVEINLDELENADESQETTPISTTTETYVENTGILDSGNRTQFSSGAVRDIQNDKGSEYLLPFKEVSEMLTMYIKDSDLDMGEKDNLDQFQYDVFDNLTEYKNTGNIKFLTMISYLIAMQVYYADIPKSIMEVAIHFKNGAIKYSTRNWEKGIPVSNYISSFIRHMLKYIRQDSDEHHERAMLWNILCAIWTIRNHPELDDFKLIKKDDDLAEE